MHGYITQPTILCLAAIQTDLIVFHKMFLIKLHALSRFYKKKTNSETDAGNKTETYYS